MQEGDFLAILGGSGWGKSSLINLILGMEHPSMGNIHLRGRNVTMHSFVKRHSLAKIAAVFQRPTNLPEMRVIDNLRLALTLAHVPKQLREERINEALGFLGLQHVSNITSDHLSPGQKRRVDLARAIAVRPEFLVLDEPTSDLDTSTCNLIMPLLKGLNHDYGISILMTTASPRQSAMASRSLHLTPPMIVNHQNHVVN